MKIPFLHQDPMTQPKRDAWLKRVCRDLSSKIATKFKMGRVQYKCDFGEQTVDYLLDQIEQEAIDTLMYIRELKRRRTKPIDEQVVFDNFMKL